MTGPLRRATELSIVLKTFSDDARPDWRPMLELAQDADRAGVDRLAVPDHVAFGEHLEEYGRPEVGGRRGGKQPTGPDGSWLEPMTTLAAISALTSRIRLSTSILLAALRRPVVLAKTAATLDALSGGRLDLGVGVGWQREEYEAAGLDFEKRGRLLDHTLEVCQALWREPRAAYRSEELEFEAIHMAPKPLGQGGVPIWVSGTVTRPVARRLARFGAGWIPWGAAADQLETSLPMMRELVAREGGDPDAFGVVGSLPAVLQTDGHIDTEASMAQVGPLRKVGVTDFRLRLSLPNDRSAALDELSSIVTRFRTVTRD